LSTITISSHTLIRTSLRLPCNNLVGKFVQWKGPVGSSFQQDIILQEFVNIINNEGRLDELIGVCDYYHKDFDDHVASFEWGLNLGAYMGKFRYGDDVFRFTVIGSPIVLYFIGTKETVRDRIHKVL